jgi:hypothetical protein
MTRAEMWYRKIVLIPHGPVTDSALQAAIYDSTEAIPDGEGPPKLMFNDGSWIKVTDLGDNQAYVDWGEK